MNKSQSLFNHALMILIFLMPLACSTKTVPTSATEKTQVAAPIETAAPLYSSTVTIGDGGLLSEQSCKPPCLWGMTPGITREAEAWEMIKAKELTNACQVWDTSSGGTRGIQCYWDNGSLTIGLESQQNEVRFIAFTPSDIVYFSDIVEKYGAPTWVALWRGDSPEHIAVELAVFLR